MKALWSYAKIFSPEECNWIVETVKKERPSWAQTGGSPNMEKVFQHRRSKIFWIDQTHPKLGYLHSKYWQVVTDMNNSCFQAHITNLPPIQFTQYSEQYQGEYKIHMDLDWLEDRNITSVVGSQRKISAIVQLSDPSTYEGGDFEFANISDIPPKEIIRKQGIMLAFPSFIYHGVKPVTKGKRYSLVGWFEGPNWR